MDKPNTLAVLGAQWGDEGKGKITDRLAQTATAIVRFNGSGNAGHTLWVNGKKFVTHQLPSGVLYPEVICLLGQGMVINPSALLSEIKSFEDGGYSLTGRLIIDPAAHAVLPSHIERDEREEEQRGKKKLGTTKRGVGPAYADKAARVGLRLFELAESTDLRYAESSCGLAARELKQYFGDVSKTVNDLILSGGRVIFEGAQSALLDIDHGSYPYVSSSSAIAGGICTGIGLSPKRVGEIIGVVKAYATRVADGPMATELPEDLGNQLRQAGGEFGATTGRPRRIGWLDLPSLRYSNQINGYTGLALTKLDTLRGFNPIRVCDLYELNDRMISNLAQDTDYMAKVKPHYTEFSGFGCDISKVRSFNNLPLSLRVLVGFIEHELAVPVVMIGVGPDRDDLIMRWHNI